MKRIDNEFQDLQDRKYAYNFDFLMHKWILDKFSSHFYSYDNCIEFGCYKGDFTKLLAGKFKHVHAVEGSSLLYDELKNNLNQFTNVQISNCMFEDFEIRNHYDSAFLIHTLEHLDNAPLILSKIQKVLTHNGKLFVVVPNANALSRQIAVNFGLISSNQSVTDGESKHGHRVTYSLDTLTSTLKESGLSILDRGGIFVKGLANFQLDQAYANGIIDDNYLQGCLNLADIYPDLCSSIYAVVK
jgi:2-polyprenyl-3-methyl-5-hydroxy-6-metoxy-1,4-benzoquinol methylase